MGNKSEVWCCMASRIEWHLPVQEETDWLRLFLFENEVENITKKATWIHLSNSPFYMPCQQTLAVHALNIDCLAALNGICTKRNTARFRLLLFKNKVNNNSQTWPLIDLTCLTTFYSKTLLLKWVMPVKEYYECEDENMNKMASFSFEWYSHTASFLLDTYKGTYNNCKELLMGDFKLKEAFNP